MTITTILPRKNIEDYVCEKLIKVLDNRASLLDADNIVWKYVDGEFVGKRSVYTFNYRSLWLEETTIENIKSWPCGIDADYTEIFKRESPLL